MDSHEESNKHRAAFQENNGGSPNNAAVIWSKNGFSASRLIMLAVCFILMMILSGCGINGTVDSHTPGLFNHYIVFPFSWLIGHFAGWFDGSYGLALIAITVLVRSALLPFMMLQYKSQQAMRMKMNRMQPEILAIKAKYDGTKDAESMRNQQQETMALYSKHGYSPLSMGCLPMLLQIPILSGLYYAIRMTPELAQHRFLWFQLGAPDVILPILAAAVYLLQAKVSQQSMDSLNGPKGMGWLIYLSPLMMGIFSFSMPSAIPLYWIIGGLLVVLQTLWGKRLYPVEPPQIAEA
ncbi:membrane protein insertase YidC [Paenibacillus solisilvae]|uniref:Membrane protein insertase YidC n=1 Tax=Paenibacillus solisilvae TaxID=2486751 RepID=A0ABW0VTJ5_9BACL